MSQANIARLLRSSRNYTGMTRAYKRAKVGAGSALAEHDAIDKLSHVELSSEQMKLRNTVLDFVKDQLRSWDAGKKECSMFVIQGDAGTGKSVVLNSLFNEVQRQANVKPAGGSELAGTKNYLVVNHPEMLKLYHRISKSFPYIKKSTLERPTSLVNTLQKTKSMADVIIIDEAHLLSTSKDAFKRFYGENHLESLMSLGKVLVIVYDDKQSLRMGSYWEENTTDGSSLAGFYQQVPEAKKRWWTLKEQFRVVAESDVLQWIEQLSSTGKILTFPKSVSSGSSTFDFRIWEDCGAMYSKLKELNEEFGQCRMLATYDFPYRLDGKDYFVTCGDTFKLRWDRYMPKSVLPWSERPDSIDEVGSVYTIQGFDLNYAGVILGRSVGYDAENNCIKLMPEFYDDHAGFTKKKNIKNTDQVKIKIIMNSINVLMTRGVKGLYLYAYDPDLRKKLLECQQAR